MTRKASAKPRGRSRPLVPASPTPAPSTTRTLSSRPSISTVLQNLSLRPKKLEVFQTPKKQRTHEPLVFEKTVVGVLSGQINGKDITCMIRDTGEYTEIGSNVTSDLRLWPKGRKQYHAYAVKTDNTLVFACLHDVSRSGFTIKRGTAEDHFHGKQAIRLADRRIHQHAVVLFDKDVVKFADHPIDFVYRHNFSLYGPTFFPRPDEGLMHRPSPLFTPEDDHSSAYKIGPWLVHNWPLGAGMFAYVNLASHEAGRLQVACKTVRIEAQEEEASEDDDVDSLTSWTGRSILQSGTDAYVDEIKILRNMCHPNIASFLDVVPQVEDGRVHLIMELVTGGDLFAYIERHRSLTESEVSFFAYQLCKALDYVHKNDLAHRDIKPDNILLAVSEAYPRLIITDFGQATSFDKLLALVPESRDEPCVRRYNTVGTLDYLPPERLKAINRRPQTMRGMMEGKAIKWHQKRLDIAERWFDEEKAIDSWGLGCVLYYCCTGTHPYWSEDEAEQEMTVCSELQGGSVWREFRKQRGSRTVAPQRTSLAPDVVLKVDRIETKISRFSSCTKWEPDEMWAHISRELRAFIASMLHHHPNQRLKLAGSDFNDFFVDRKGQLEAMYQAVVERGRTWS